MNANAQYLLDIGEPFASGLLELADSGSLAEIYCRAYRRYYETCPIKYRAGAPLFPAGVTTRPYEYPATAPLETPIHRTCVFPHYAYQYMVDWNTLKLKSARGEEIMREFNSEYRYTGYFHHSMLNYKRILAEGIDEYERRLLAKKDSSFRAAMLDLIAGLRAYHSRALAELPGMGAPAELLDALSRVPFTPAKTIYEACVALNFCLSLDGWDNVGRLDSILSPYHQGEDIRHWLRCMMISMQENDRWSITLGPDYSDITRQALEASTGLARPMIQLRTTKDMPNDLWELACKRILEGGGQPAFYNEKAIIERLKRRIPHLTHEDAMEFAGGGCTETSFAGYTCASGTDLNINVLQIFEQYMHENLPKTATFEEFYENFCTLLHQKQDEQMAEINARWNECAERCFAPIRTLFVEDCLDKETGWLQSGARYTFAIHSDSGMPNTIDSLLAIRHLIYEEKRYTPEAFLALLTAEDPDFFTELRACPAYGVGDPHADGLVKDLTTRFYEHYLTGKLDLGIGFFPTAHQFSRHVAFGSVVGPTPDGRHAGTPEADSLAPVNGKAVKGPTLMLVGASCYEQKDVYGMAVTNLSITRKYRPEVLRALVEGYFDMGGTQLQITVVDKDTLQDARQNPDNHRDLIVRVGGYSEYFCKLSDSLKDAVIARTLFDV